MKHESLWASPIPCTAWLVVYGIGSAVLWDAGWWIGAWAAFGLLALVAVMARTTAATESRNRRWQEEDHRRLQDYVRSLKESRDD